MLYKYKDIRLICRYKLESVRTVANNYNHIFNEFGSTAIFVKDLSSY